MTFPIKSVISKLIGNKTSFMIFSHKSTYFFGNAANLWHIFIFAGVFALTAPYLITLEVSLTRTIIVGCVSILTGLVLRLNYNGIQIDIKNDTYRNFNAVLGIKHGKWKKLPELQKIVFTSKNVSSWNTPNGISPTFKTNSTIYTVALIADSENPVLFLQTENEKAAIEKAKFLAKELKLTLS
jgi:hypothetical protein